MQELGEALLMAPDESTGVCCLGPELVLAVRQAVCLQLDRVPILILAYQHEVPIVGHQHLAVVLPVACDLLGVSRHPGIVTCRLDLDGTAIRRLRQAEKRLLLVSLLPLLLGEKAAVRVPTASISKLKDAADTGLQSVADAVEEIGEGIVVGLLPDSTARQTDLAEVPKVGFQELNLVIHSAACPPP